MKMIKHGWAALSGALLAFYLIFWGYALVCESGTIGACSIDIALVQAQHP